MSKLDIVSHSMDHTIEKVLKVFDKAIMLIPDDQLKFKPTETNMSAKEISYHVYQVAFAFTRGTESGELLKSDFDLIPFNPDEVKTAVELVDYGRSVKDYMRNVVPRFTEVHMDRIRLIISAENRLALTR